MRKIGLGLKHECYAIVDDEDYLFLMNWKWFCRPTAKYIYAYRYSTSSDYEVSGVTTSRILMHRIIMKTPPHLEVDHINHNTLDNRKANLRNVTKRQNAQNRVDQAKSIGVQKDRTGKYVVCASIDGKRQYGGRFKHRIAAERAYRQLIKNGHTLKQVHHGER